MSALYEYKVVSMWDSPGTTERPVTLEETANHWAKQGWRTVGIRPASILIEREKSPKYEYMEVEVVESVGKTSNQWAESGWEVVSVFPRPRRGFWDIVSFNILFRRAKQTEYLPGTEGFEEWRAKQKRSEIEHNHPLGVMCSDECPALIASQASGLPQS